MRTRKFNDERECIEIIKRCQWCHVAMVDSENNPYVIPMNFGFDGHTIYLHGSAHGKKIEILKSNPRVCIHFSTDHVLRYQSEQVACSWSMKYRSVLCYGKVAWIEDTGEKVTALNIIMAQYTNREFNYNPPSIKEVCVMKIKVDRYEGRIFGY